MTLPYSDAMDQVKIHANVSAHGLRKGAEVTVAETPTIAGAIRSGVFTELDRIPAKPKESTDNDGQTPSKVEDVPLTGEAADALSGPSDDDLVRAMTEPVDGPESAEGNDLADDLAEPDTKPLDESKPKARDTRRRRD